MLLEYKHVIFLLQFYTKHMVCRSYHDISCLPSSITVQSVSTRCIMVCWQRILVMLYNAHAACFIFLQSINHSINSQTIVFIFCYCRDVFLSSETRKIWFLFVLSLISFYLISSSACVQMMFTCFCLKVYLNRGLV